MIFDARTVSMLVKETWRTLYMVGLSSLISYLIGIPLGVALVVTDKDGIRPVPLFNKVVGVIVNLLRSVPFIILLAMVMPLTRAIVGKTIGANAAVVPLVIAAFPYISRMVEASLKEIDAGVIEAAKSMGASCLWTRRWKRATAWKSSPAHRRKARARTGCASAKPRRRRRKSARS